MRLIEHVRRNAIAYVALFVALAGTSYAAVELSRNSVGAKQIKRNAVRAAEIKKNAVRDPELRPASVSSDEIKDGSVAAAEIAASSVGIEELEAGAIPGPVLGFARVEPRPGGTADVDEGFALNITDDMVVNPDGAPGFFCFRGLQFEARHVQATVEHTDAAGQTNPGFATAGLGNNFEACGIDNEQAVVQTATASSPQGADRSFFVVFFGLGSAGTVD